MNYYDKYGKITLSKGTILYHWSNENINYLSDNLFLCLDNSFWSDKNKILHKYKLSKDINLILTIKNDNITNKQLYNNKNKKQDYELLTSIYNEIVVQNSYSRHGDVSLKMNKKNFPIFCDKLNVNSYEGLFNYIDGDKGQFEIVIFNPNIYLNLIDTKVYHIVKLHKLRDCKRFMLSKKIKYIFPHKYNYEDISKREHNHYPSIFYYIYKKTTYIQRCKK
jgi:hypothetical protein